jgi:hypothetical protein
MDERAYVQAYVIQLFPIWLVIPALLLVIVVGVKLVKLLLMAVKGEPVDLNRNDYVGICFSCPIRLRCADFTDRRSRALVSDRPSLLDWTSHELAMTRE